MAKIIINREQTIGPIKPMHCVNNGPMCARTEQVRGNFDTYKALKIPFARNHDASFCSSYGGPHTVDINAVFPSFDKDENDPASYDFHLTDEYIRNTLAAGTQTFYRLGSRIEHETKKYGTLPPPDFHKWARICEHIIRHYNEGWADGYRLNMPYWEIWNEPDGAPDDADPYWKKCWGGTKAQFFDLFSITARHLKSCFPGLKIGGPAVCSPRTQWSEDFLTFCSKNQVPLDFFSWHGYTETPEGLLSESVWLRRKLDELGYEKTESICNEWNYLWDWSDHFIDSILAINALKGAAFTAATMVTGQNLPIDMLMYYDFRPCAFCGPFNFYTMRPQKPYYPFLMFSSLYQMGTQVSVSSDDGAVYALGAADKDGKTALLVSYYGPHLEKPVTVSVSGLAGDEKLWLLDEKNDMAQTALEIRDGTAVITVDPYTVIFLK